MFHIFLDSVAERNYSFGPQCNIRHARSFRFADLRNSGRCSRVVCICRMEVLIMSACDFHKYAGDRELSQSAPPEEFRSVR